MLENNFLLKVGKKAPSYEVFEELKNYIDKSIDNSLKTSPIWEELKSDNPVVYDSIRNFLLGSGKRLRPSIFFLIYQYYTDNPDLFNAEKTMLAMELVHAFILVHDDIIDKSDERRNTPTLHVSLNNYIKNLGLEELIWVSGEDLAIVAGDMIYAMAINTFSETELPHDTFIKALKNLTRTAMLTAHGEFNDILEVFTPLDKIDENNLFKIYDQKTAYYTFCTPAILAALLAGKEEDIQLLEEIGIFLGRAFQILNDLKEITDYTTQTTTFIPKDIVERKRTLLIHWAYKNSNPNDQNLLQEYISSDEGFSKYEEVISILENSGALNIAKKHINNLKNETKNLVTKLNMNTISKENLLICIDIVVPALN